MVYQMDRRLRAEAWPRPRAGRPEAPAGRPEAPAGQPGSLADGQEPPADGQEPPEDGESGETSLVRLSPGWQRARGDRVAGRTRRRGQDPGRRAQPGPD